MVQHLPIKYKTLSSTPSSTRERDRQTNRDRERGYFTMASLRNQKILKWPISHMKGKLSCFMEEARTAQRKMLFTHFQPFPRCSEMHWGLSGIQRAFCIFSPIRFCKAALQFCLIMRVAPWAEGKSNGHLFSGFPLRRLEHMPEPQVFVNASYQEMKTQ
jgi:hypothetical protein